MPDHVPALAVSQEIAESLNDRRPVVALESAVLTHGLPFPRNIEALDRMEAAVRAGNAAPATCLVHGGRLWVGASRELSEAVASDPAREKAAARDVGRVLALGLPAGLTVSATLRAAALAGVRTFATGGIGGVHLDVRDTGDISADLPQLACSPVVTVCSGAKSVLDIPRTLEYLETAGVPVYSYRTTRFPAFYLRESGCESVSVSGSAEIARIARAQWDMGLEIGVVVANPIPAEAALSEDEWTVWLRAATEEAASAGVRGKAVTPFLLGQVAALSGGRTVEANLALLAANAGLAAEIAGELCR